MQVKEQYIKAVQLAKEQWPDGGTILEFGVARGTTYIHVAQQILDGWNCRLIGFDSWQGLPVEESEIFHYPTHTAGRFKCDRFTVEKRIFSHIGEPDERLELIDGWYCDSLTKELQKQIENLIFVNIDVDLYVSAMQVLNFITPLLRKDTIVYFDEWLLPIEDKKFCDGGEKLAVEQWSKINPDINYELVDIQPIQQLMIIK